MRSCLPNVCVTLPRRRAQQAMETSVRKIILAAAAVTFLSGAASAQTTTWQYGAGNGDPIPYPGPKPTYSYAYGPGNGDPMKPTGTPQSSFAYGGDNAAKGGMIQMTAPPPQQRMASPAPAKAARPGSHG